MANRKPEWAEKHYAFFCNRDCEYFPCHSGVAPEAFNCLFCYCPLYVLGPSCGGNFVLREDGSKDCGGCAFPHWRENYGVVMEKYPKILALMKAQKDG